MSGKHMEQDRLLRACKDGAVTAVRALLENGEVDVDAVYDSKGWGPLHHASYGGHMQVAELLLKAGADLNAATKERSTPLHIASSWGHWQVVEVLLKAGADSSATDKKGRTSLHRASSKGHLQVVERLVKADTDLNLADKERSTPLHVASSWGHWQVVEVLLTAGADPNAATKEGSTPLFNASSWGHVQVVEVLLVAGADPNAADTKGRTSLHRAPLMGRLQVAEALLTAGADPNAATKTNSHTPLHFACISHQSDLAQLLLASGADLHAKDNEGHEPIHFCIRPYGFRSFFTAATLETLQVLVSFGATWDFKCDDLVTKGTAWEEASALHICVSLWSQELADGLPFTNIPLEVIERGVPSTKAYIDALKKSVDFVLRRKICLVGSSCAGKTSFVKSIISGKPQLVHVDDRTIGIDHFPLRFSESIAGSGDEMKIHEVTFWDFAGQDAYQVSHSLFFSRRTLYLVCVDLEAFTTAFLQASIMSDVKKQETQLMNEFIDRTVMRWVHLIFARQPDAEFVFIATKEDLLAENHVTERLLKSQLETKLAEVETIVHEMKSKSGKTTGNMPSATEVVAAGSTTQPGVLFVSCTSLASSQDARTKIEDLVIKSGYSFQMPDTYSRALAEIVRIREAAKCQDITTRISQIFAPADSLSSGLNIEPELCRPILQTLHDLGDVLWYEDLGVNLFQNTVILDPLLLIDFIRQVFNHKNTGQVLPHADLKAMPYWLALEDDKQMEAMKQVLQAFHLVYSADHACRMEWDSDLIVPALWQTKTPAAWLFLGDVLRINTTLTCEGEAVRVHWEYHFEFGLPSSLFDHLIIASVSPYVQFDAGPDWILCEEQDIAACRIMVGRDPKSLHRTIHVEAVLADTATAAQAETLWESFEQLCGAFVKVLRENPGLLVSSFAWDDKQNKISMKRLVRSRPKSSSRKWMPPADTWDWFMRLMAEG